MARRGKGRTRTVYHPRRTFRSRFSSRGRGMLGGAKGIFHIAASGVGGGAVAEIIAAKVFPSGAPVAGLAGSYVAAGFKGVIAKVIFDAITGKSSLLGGLGLGGSSGMEML